MAANRKWLHGGLVSIFKTIQHIETKHLGMVTSGTTDDIIQLNLETFVGYELHVCH